MANPSLFLCFSSHGVFVNAHLPICSESPLKSTSVNFPHKPNELVSIFFTVDGIVIMVIGFTRKLMEAYRLDG